MYRLLFVPLPSSFDLSLSTFPLSHPSHFRLHQRILCAMAATSVSLAVPSSLAGWERVVAMALGPGGGGDSHKGLFHARLRLWEQAAREHRAMGTLTWSPQVLDEVLEHCRGKVAWPIRPSILDTEPEEFLVFPKNPAEAKQPPFTWRWLDVPMPWVDEDGVGLDVFPLPVACLEDVFHGCTHLLSLTALYHLLPEAQGSHTRHKALSQVVSTTQGDAFWALMRGLGVEQAECLPSSRAQSHRKDDASSSGSATGDEDEEPPLLPIAGRLKFNQFMCTPKMLLGFLAWMAHIKRQAKPMQHALFSCVQTLCRLQQEFLCAGVAVNGGRVDGDDLERLLRDMGVLEMWENMRTVFPERPSLAGALPAEWLVWFALRHCDRSPLLRNFCAAVIDTLAQQVEGALPSKAHADFPTCRLPHDIRVRQALKGDDKTMLRYSHILARNKGFGNKDDCLLQEHVYTDNFRAYLRYTARSLAATYLDVARFGFLQLIQARMLVDKISGDAVLFDASRVARKELLLVKVFSCGMLSSAPLQILPDQGAKHGAATAVDSAAKVVAGERPTKIARVGEAAFSECVGVVHSALAVLPFKTWQVYAPSSSCRQLLGDQRVTCESTGFDYIWRPASGTSAKKSQWLLSPELRSLCGRRVRILVLCADEGSPGWSLFQFLANFVGLRVVFFPDPPHRLSNVFTNTLRGVRNVLNSTMDSLVIHKFRRAPYGTGKMWRQLQESLDILLGLSNLRRHPYVQTFLAGIANDHHWPVAVLESDSEQLAKALRLMLSDPLGPKVELRRWFTVLLADESIDSLWHTMLLALCWQFAMDGVDPWALAAKIIAKSTRDDNEDAKTFKFKHSVLVFLFDTMNQRILRSRVKCCARMKLHHERFIAEAANPKAYLEYMQLWASQERWLNEMVLPSLRDAFTPEALRGIGFCQSVDAFAFNFLDNLDGVLPEDEDQQMLVTHLHLAVSCMGQLLSYGILAQSPPWCYCLMLSASTRNLAMGTMRAIHSLRLRLSASKNPLHRELLDKMPFLQWPVLVEPLELLHAAGWNLESELGKFALSYIEAIFESMMGTYLLENVFNDMRDNEARGARHKTRGNDLLQSLAISSVTTRYGEVVPHVEVKAEDVAARTKEHCRPAAFLAEKAPTTERACGFDPTFLKGNKKKFWESTSVDRFRNEQMPLLRALMRTDAEMWPKLWIASLLKPHMVVAARDNDATACYIIKVTTSDAMLLQLDGVAPACTFSPSGVVCSTSITSLTSHWCYDYEMALDISEGEGYRLRIDLSQVYTLFDYICLNYVHLLNVHSLKLLLEEQTGVRRGGWNQLQLVQALLDETTTMSDEAKEKMLDRVRALMAKRARKKKKAPEEGVEDEGDEEEEPEEEEEEVDHGPVPSILQTVCPSEIDFLLRRGARCAKALTDETDDEGLDFRAPAPGPSASSSSGGAGGAEPPPLPPAPPAPPLPPLPPPSQPPSPDPEARPHAAEARPDAADPERPDLSRMPKVPRVEEMEAPRGCTLSRHEPATGRPYWQAKLPRGKVFRFMGSATGPRRYFGEGCRTSQAAKAICWQYLCKAEEDGVLDG